MALMPLKVKIGNQSRRIISKPHTEIIRTNSNFKAFKKSNSNIGSDLSQKIEKETKSRGEEPCVKFYNEYAEGQSIDFRDVKEVGDFML